MKEQFLFNTLWAIVMNKLNKRNIAHCSQLEKIIEDADLPSVFPYKPLPNVKDFRIKLLSPYDPILLKHGIQRRLDKAELEWTPYKNRSINRYVRHQFDRLNKNRHRPHTFWSIATTLLFHSPAYRTICFNHVFPRWHRKYKYSVVKNILRNLSDLNLHKYLYKILHIPKPNGGTRPLGIPNPSWRVFLHGLNNILLVWLSPYVHPQQHGFYPGRGTLTAWKHLMTKLSSRSIYEFDMKQFFDTVNLQYLENVLLITGIPSKITKLIISWNQALPKNSPRHGIT
jgi:hypothetical protein